MARRIVGAAAAMALACMFLAHPSAAQPAPSLSARLSRIIPWTSPERPLSLSLRLTNAGGAPSEQPSVRVAIYSQVESRSELRSALDFQPRGDPIALTTEELSPIAPHETRNVQIVRDLRALASSFASGAQSGVYPVRIGVRDASGDVAKFTTGMIFFSSLPQSRISVVWVWPVHHPGPYASDGGYAEDGVRALLDPDRLGRSLAQLTARQAPVTIAPSGILLDTLTDLADGFTLARDGRDEQIPRDHPLAQAAAALLNQTRQTIGQAYLEVASASYARADLIRLVHQGLAHDAGVQVSLGRDRVAAVTGRSPLRPLFVPADYRVDARSAVSLAALGVNTLVLDPTSLPPQASAPFQAGIFGPSRPVTVQGVAGTTFSALLIDRAIAERLNRHAEDRVVLAQNVLAEIASAWHELPALASERLLVIAPRDTLAPSTTAALLTGLAQAPWVTMRTASNAVAALPAQGSPVRLPVATPPRGELIDAIGLAHRVLETVSEVMPAARPQREYVRRLIFAAESLDWAANRPHALVLADAATDRGRGLLRRIRTPNRHVTLTSRAGLVPVTVVNRTGVPVRLRVRLVSSKLTFPSGDERVVRIPGRVRTLSVPAEAKAAGSFPIEVRLETIDGTRFLGRGLIVVRSTAVSAVTLMATGGAGLFLLAAWGRRVRRERARARSESGG